MKASIWKREGKRGTVWYGRVDLPPDPETGKRRQKRFNAPTKREIDKLAAEIIVKAENGGFAEADIKKLTVSDYLTRWVSSLEGSVKPTTRQRYADLLKNHVQPTIGRVQLAKLTPLDVQKLYADKLKGGLSPTTVSLIHNILHHALKQAVRWGLLTRNVTEAVDPPREATPEYITWNQQQAAAFLAVADEHELAALWRLALLTGMRRGEMLGLKWEDLDLGKGLLAVKRTLSRGTGGAYTFGTPKTAHGRRSIALPRSAVESLQKHRLQQLERRLESDTPYHDQGLVFANEMGEPLHPNSVAYQFKRLISQAGVPVIRIHDLRHTSATLMLANNVHPKIVQERLGHANISMTLDRYSHVTMDMQRDAADRLDDLVNGLG
jgi:integrase